MINLYENILNDKTKYKHSNILNNVSLHFYLIDGLELKNLANTKPNIRLTYTYMQIYLYHSKCFYTQ